MRSILLALLLGSVVAAHAVLQADPKLVGTWQMVAFTKNGEKVPEEKLKNKVVIFDEKTLMVKEGDRDDEKVEYRADPTTKPASMDISKGGKVLATGIYELKGDDLKMAFNKGDERPKDFEKLDQQSALLILKRKK
jgi:uncharacterized protein (TIGR03067 family)